MPAQQEDVRHGRKARLTSNDSGLLEAAQRFWQKSYAGDYLGLILLTGAYMLLRMFGEPFHQMFTLDDVRLQHPHADIERVGVFYLFIYAAAVPIIFLLLYTLLYCRDTHKAHVSILGCVISILLTVFLTDVFKNAIGRPRPDLIARCKPQLSTPKHELVYFTVCKQTEHHLLHDGWRSFPSGHSSFAFSGLGYLALFLASQTHVLRARASLFVVLVCLVPLLGAAMIAISRLEDYRHDVADVIAGSLLGILIAYLNWRRYYPGLLSKFCDEPYSAPGSTARAGANSGFQRVRDEEEVYGGESERFSIGDDRGSDR